MAILQNLGQILQVAALRFGAKCALISDGRSFSFAELDRLSSRLANALAGIGVGRGDRVTLCSQNCWQWVVSYYAAARIGAVLNPANVMLTPEEMVYALNDCGATTLLASREKAEPLLDFRKQCVLEKVITFDENVPTGTLSFNRLLAEARQEADQPLSVPDDISTIAYTSGTTGFPKGAILTHRAVMLNSAMTSTMHSRSASDVVVTALPTAHVYGNVVMNSAFLCGMTLVLLSRFDPEHALSAIEDYRATLFEGVPTMYHYLLNCPSLARRRHSTLRCCTVGGQTMPVAKLQEVEDRFGCPLLELWGMTEIAGLGTTHPFLGPNRLGSIGVPLPYVRCRIARPGHPRITRAPGEVGELLVRGPILMNGYYRQPEATSETIDADGWLHTGDLAKADSDGFLYVVDRLKDMIVTAGYNVYPAEIERVIAEYAGVSLVAVAGVPDEIKGEAACAFIVQKSGANLDETSILRYCRERLAAYKVPRSVRFVADLPRTSTGKVLRRQLKLLA